MNVKKLLEVGSMADLADVEETLAAVFAAGKLVVFPTETFYAVGGRIDNVQAMDLLGRIKDRPKGSAFPLIAASRTDVQAWASIPQVFLPLVEAYWPGPLTLALQPRRRVSTAALDKSGTLGLRVSPHPVACCVARAAGGVVIATSANMRGEPPVTTIGDLNPHIAQQVDCVIDGGATAGGLPSTVVRMDSTDVVICRSGAVSRQQLQSVMGNVHVRVEP
ncbi:MAG: L-threonylcarbamoyladenylate synthase [Myxococcota bacterium]